MADPGEPQEALEPQKVFCFDLDGTLCVTEGADYENARPLPWAIERVNALYDQGHKIIIFTARGGTTGIDWRKETLAQLERWGVRYDDLRMAKPGADVYVDDKAVHVDAWRYGHHVGLGIDEGPSLPPPAATTVVEVGRTYGGRPMWVAEHAEAALAAARRACIPTGHDAAAVEAAVRDALEPHDLLEEGDDVTFAIALAGLPHAAYADTLDAASGPQLTVRCRLLSQAASGLRRVRADTAEGLAVVASSAGADAADRAWPLAAGPDGELVDLHGGQVACVEGETLVCAATDGLPEPVEATSEPVTVDRGLAADEVLLLGEPFCVLPVADLDGTSKPAPGPVARELLRSWSDAVGVDVAAQLAALVG